MQCILCNKNITLESKDNFAVKIDDKHYCLQCSEVLDFASDTKHKKTEKIEKPKIISNSFWFCKKCKVKQSEKTCSTCKLVNPLCR